MQYSGILHMTSCEVQFCFYGVHCTIYQYSFGYDCIEHGTNTPPRHQLHKLMHAFSGYAIVIIIMLKCAHTYSLTLH